MANDTSLFGLIPLEERQSIVEQHQRFINGLGDETLEDFYSRLDQDHYSSDEYKEYDPKTGDIIDIASSGSSFVFLEESDEEPTQAKQTTGAARQIKAEKAPTTTKSKSLPAAKSANIPRSLSHSYSDDESEKDVSTTGAGSKRKRVEPNISGRKVSNKARKTSSSSQTRKPKAKNPPKQQRRRASSKRRVSKPVKASEDEAEDEDGSTEEVEMEELEPCEFTKHFRQSCDMG